MPGAAAEIPPQGDRGIPPAGDPGGRGQVVRSARPVGTSEGEEEGSGRGAIVATVERARRGAWVVRVAGGPALEWRRNGPGHRWAVDGDGGTLLRLAAIQGLLRASMRITVQQAMPERSTELLCLLGGFLALRELQAEVDTSAALWGIVATAAG